MFFLFKTCVFQFCDCFALNFSDKCDLHKCCWGCIKIIVVLVVRIISVCSGGFQINRFKTESFSKYYFKFGVVWVKCLKSWPEVLRAIISARTIIKGTVSRDGYFFEGLNISISPFCVCADSFQGLSKAFHCPIQLFICFFLKLLTNFQIACWNSPQNSLLCDWWMFSSADLSWAAGENARELTCHWWLLVLFYRITGSFL